MAITSGTSTVQNENTVPASSNAQPDNNQPIGKWSFHNKGAFGRAPLGFGIGSEALTSLNIALLEEYKQSSPDFIIKTISITTARRSPHFSCLIVCLQDRANPKAGVAYHTLIVEASAPALMPRNEVIKNMNVEIMLVTSDSYDNDLLVMVVDAVRKEYPGLNIFNTLATVVPRSFNDTDKILVQKLAANTGIALSTELELRSNGPEFNLVNAAGDSKLQVALSFSNQTTDNMVGQPVRSDVSVQFISQQTKWSPNVSVNSGERAEPISSLSGFIDLVWFRSMAPANNYVPQQQPMQYGMAGPVPTQQYFPRFVITSMESDFAATPSFQLLQLVTATAIGAEGNWMHSFKQTPTAGKKRRSNWHDIGAIGIEVNADSVKGVVGQRFDTTGDNFRADQLKNMLSAFITEGMVLSLDVSECGPDTWRTNLFSAAANGFPEAVDAIIGAANQLTGGYFSKMFQPGTPIFDDLGNRIHTGYYIDDDGAKRDIRELDYLGVANKAGDTSPESIRDWSDTFTQIKIPLEVRLSARKKMIMNIIPDAIFTGFAHRVTFTTDFLTALTAACRQAGLDMSIVTPMNANDFNNARATPQFMAHTLMPTGTPAVFSQNNNSTQSSSGYGGFNPRWSR